MPVPDGHDPEKWFEDFMRSMRDAKGTPLSDEHDTFSDLKQGDVVKLSRTGYCHLACLMLFDELEIGVPCGIKNSELEGSYAHYFLCVDGMALDLGGYFTLEQMIAFFPSDGPVEEVSWNRVKKDRDAAGLRDDEYEIVRQRFSDHIEQNKLKWLNSRNEKA